MKLTNARYEEIKRTITDLLEDYKINSFPIDISYLAKCLSAKFVLESSIYKSSEYWFSDVEGAILIDKVHLVNKIYIANVTTYKTRQYFSACHEMGHFILGHTESNPQTETEAHFFAGYLIAPSCLVLHKKLGKILLEKDYLIPQIFGISLDAADHVYMRFVKRKSLGVDIQDYERRILELFKDNIDEIVERYENYEI